MLKFSRFFQASIVIRGSLIDSPQPFPDIPSECFNTKVASNGTSTILLDIPVRQN